MADVILSSIIGGVQDSITDGVTTIAPSQNAVFDALAAIETLLWIQKEGGSGASAASGGDDTLNWMGL